MKWAENEQRIAQFMKWAENEQRIRPVYEVGRNLTSS
jgi:hypothetical protein